MCLSVDGSAVTFGRIIHKDMTLGDGFHIPAGTIIGVPSHAITHDPKLYPDPEKFDGYRFLAPEDATHESRLPSFVTTNAANLSWGYGKHACSGRFFASYEIKMVLSHLLLHYDFKFPEDIRGRPSNISFELQNSPDPAIKILLRKRKTFVEASNIKS